MRLRLEDIAQAVGAVGDLGDREEMVVERVQTDSRAVRPGELFVCLPGRNFDGHQFAANAAAAGAAAILASKPLDEADAPVLLVRDTTQALQRLAAFWRSRFEGLVIAVTGSAGKTTVKEMIAAICSQERNTAKSYKNWNGQLGLPLSILATSGSEEVWVMECGIDEPGGMDVLGPIVRPDIAVIHNVGAAHLERLGSIEGVARAKSRLLNNLAADGRALVSKDYPELLEAATTIAPPLSTSSVLDDGADFSCTYQGSAPAGGGRFALRLKDHELELALPFCGAHYAENLAAAAGAAYLAGASLTAVRHGLSETHIPEQRFQCRMVDAWSIIDDSYNANPLSMRRAIESAAEMTQGRPLYGVLGDMLELGEIAVEAHRELGGLLAEAGFAEIFYHGDQADEVRAGLADAGSSAAFHIVETPRQFRQAWTAAAHAPGVVLVKGSRAGRLEEYARELAELVREESR